MITVATIQPKVLQHIMGFIIVASIEALEVALIARMKITDLLFQ
jgi:hypothetical protein